MTLQCEDQVVQVSQFGNLCALLSLQTVEGGMRLSFQHTIAENRRVTTYFAFCYPYSYSECQKKMARLDERFRQQTDNVDIYYHRYVHVMNGMYTQHGQEQNASIPSPTTFDGL